MSEKNGSYKTDSKGQFEINNIDTPLGQKAEDFIKADAEVKVAAESKQKAMIELIGELKANKIRTLKYKGETLRYKSGHITPDKIQLMPAE